MFNKMMIGVFMSYKANVQAALTDAGYSYPVSGKVEEKFLKFCEAKGYTPVDAASAIWMNSKQTSPETRTQLVLFGVLSNLYFNQ
jgi:hypothetical protein